MLTRKSRVDIILTYIILGLGLILTLYLHACEYNANHIPNFQHVSIMPTLDLHVSIMPT
jgi:hypothetical protein